MSKMFIRNFCFLALFVVMVLGFSGCSDPTAVGIEDTNDDTAKMIRSSLQSTNMPIVSIKKVAFKSKNSGKYLCADLDYGPDAPLYCNRDAIGLWETFYWIEFENDNGDGYHALLSCATGKYVCAENDGTSRAVANREWVREWEQFYIYGKYLGGGQFATIISYPRKSGKYNKFNVETMIPDSKDIYTSFFDMIILD